MELFNRFRETVFLKEESDLEKQLTRLKGIKDKVDKNDKIDKDIKLIEIGINGENNIVYELKTSNIGVYVLRDVCLSFEDLTAQIDFVIVTKAYVYLVECKNLIGNITVNNQGEFKRDYYLGKKNIVESMYSPYRQAVRHKDILKKIWLSSHSKLSSFLFEKNFDKTYKPLVVLSNSKALLNVRYATKEIKDHIVRVDNLIDYIKKDIDSYNKEVYMNKKMMESVAISLLKRHQDKTNNFVDKYEVINTTLEKDDKTIEEKLKAFRKARALNLKIPAYYVYTDEEMNCLINLKPKTIEDLKKANILSAIKIKCHGEEIVKLLNEENDV